MILQMVSGGQVWGGGGGGGSGQLSLTLQWWAISGQDESIVPLGKRQSSLRLLSHVPVRHKKIIFEDYQRPIMFNFDRTADKIM